MLQQQFDQLKEIRKGFVYKDFEVVENKIIKKSYYRKTNENPNKVIEECREFYLEDDKISEKITKRECDFAIFSKNQFVLPEGCSFGEPTEENYKYHDNPIELAFQFGIEFKESHGKLSPVKWLTLGEIVKQLEFILLEGAGYRIISRKADTAYFSFQDEHYLVTHSSAGFTLHKRDSPSHISGREISTFKTVMELVLAVGVEKFQFGISDNGGD